MAGVIHIRGGATCERLRVVDGVCVEAGSIAPGEGSLITDCSLDLGVL
jgi:hypothetical protein